VSNCGYGNFKLAKRQI